MVINASLNGVEGSRVRRCCPRRSPRTKWNRFHSQRAGVNEAEANHFVAETPEGRRQTRKLLPVSPRTWAGRSEGASSPSQPREVDGRDAEVRRDVLQLHALLDEGQAGQQRVVALRSAQGQQLELTVGFAQVERLGDEAKHVPQVWRGRLERADGGDVVQLHLCVAERLDASSRRALREHVRPRADQVALEAEGARALLAVGVDEDFTQHSRQHDAGEGDVVAHLEERIASPQTFPTRCTVKLRAGA
jgi:hypothetical protein